MKQKTPTLLASEIYLVSGLLDTLKARISFQQLFDQRHVLGGTREVNPEAALLVTHDLAVDYHAVSLITRSSPWGVTYIDKA